MERAPTTLLAWMLKSRRHSRRVSLRHTEMHSQRRKHVIAHLQALPRPLLIAHRGASADAPENTLAAFERACRAGARMIETDARLTRDGQVVLLHDARLERTTEQSGAVARTDAAQVQAADAGYWFSPPGAAAPAYPWRGRGERVPTLAQTLAWLAAAWPAVRLNVEVKADGDDAETSASVRETVAAVLHVVEEQRATQRVLLSSFSRGVVAHVRRANPTIDAALIVAGEVVVAEAISWSQAHGCTALHPQHDLLGAPADATRHVQAAQAAGLRVHAWTVNAVDRMRELAGAGVSGIMTDDPDLLRQTLAG